MTKAPFNRQFVEPKAAVSEANGGEDANVGFDFIGSDKPATSAQSATSGNLEYGMTVEQIREAQALAESPEGLDIAAFMKKHRIIEFDVEQVLAHKFPKEE